MNLFSFEYDSYINYLKILLNIWNVVIRIHNNVNYVIILNQCKGVSYPDDNYSLKACVM